MCLCCCCGLSSFEFFVCHRSWVIGSVLVSHCIPASLCSHVNPCLSVSCPEWCLCQVCVLYFPVVSGFVVIVCPVCMTFDLPPLVSSCVFISTVSPFVYLYSLLCDPSYACCVTLSFMFPSSALTWLFVFCLLCKLLVIKVKALSRPVSCTSFPRHRGTWQLLQFGVF